jgi:2-aminoadipate transaminase
MVKSAPLLTAPSATSPNVGPTGAPATEATPASNRAPIAAPIAAVVGRAGSSAIRDLLELTEHPEIRSLAGGLPNARTFPVAAMAEAAAAVLAEDPVGALQYGPTEGYRPLRELVAEDTGSTADHVLITTGSQQAIELAAQALVDPGATVALADPAYVGALQAFRAGGARLCPIPIDEHGLRVDVLTDRLSGGLRPALVYVVASFDNPSGTSLSAERRVELAALADRYGFWIVDDDPYGRLRWAGTAPAPLRATSDRVLTLGTASKVLCPGVRVGWATLPAEAHRALTVLKQAADLHTSSLDQRLVHRLLADGPGLDAHLARIRAAYAEQAAALAGALRARFGAGLTFAEPEGGMFLWARLADDLAPGVEGADLLHRALAHGVAFVPGTAFAVRPGTHGRSVRLSFATGSPAKLVEAADRLAAALGA